MRSRSDLRLHPCLDCPLPDCDETSSKCNLRRAANTYHNLRRRGEHISDEVRQRYNIAFAELHADKRNEKRRAAREARP